MARHGVVKLIEKAGGRILKEMNDIENLYKQVVSPTVIAVACPTKFRRVKYIMALAKGKI